MEDLVSSPSFSRSVLSCSEGQAQSGESSWTDYFVDFMLSEEEEKKRQEGANSYCATEDDGDGSSHGEEEEDSMVSDAASRAPASALLPARYKGLKKLKKAFKALDHDDSLEDTASSPVNSPKVSAVSQLELSPKRRCNIRDLTKEAGIGDDHGREGVDCTDAAMEGVRFGDQSQTSIAPCAELKDKGICLFPLSVLLHYHGRTN
ncbi:hypothetical protein PAHAL_2G392400 [Panicum hallii]|uniref:Uncharacterized protein n=1 Tax=Panicum hallii TaxID=206008 RepID=A0A2S3H2S8_9POAL|nr:vascular-related unknown protein 1-like isoform X1 [Panicum hallii]PAN14219.1 hypothetical protein PAHAL_2G392400 [Panicum hallii]